MVHAMAYNACAVLCLVCQSIGEVPPPLPTRYRQYSIDFYFKIFTLYFKYFLRILCTFHLSRFCLQYFLPWLTQVILLLINNIYFYFYSSTNSKQFNFLELVIPSLLDKQRKNDKWLHCTRTLASLYQNNESLQWNNDFTVPGTRTNQQ
jgi:hypothetical protein